MRKTHKTARMRGWAGAAAITLLTAAAYGQKAVDAGIDSFRQTLQPAKITCRGKEFDGMRGTLFVPEARNKRDSRVIELPVIVVKSLAPNPDRPVFQCNGGPGATNITPDYIDEATLKKHDVVSVGYRGIDGTPLLDHPVLNGLLATPGLSSRSALQEAGKKASQAIQELRDRGIDVQQYNILNVIDDFEAARAALGCDKINLSGTSYGGAVAYAYCVRHGERVNRAVLLEPAFPYDIAVSMPEDIDARLAHYNELWKKDPAAVKRSPDILKTMRTVLSKLPADYKGIPLDRAKIEFLTYFACYSERAYVNMAFDAFISAEAGDFSSLAVMCPMYDHMVTKILHAGDLLGKTYSSVSRPDRDYVSELARRDSILGSPMSLVAWGIFQYSNWPVQAFIKEHPRAQKTDVKTLIFYGSKEMGEAPRRDYAQNFTNGQWVILDDLLHTDIFTITGEGTAHLIHRFIDDGVVDTSKLDQIPPWDFTPKTTLLQMFQQMTQGQKGKN